MYEISASHFACFLPIQWWAAHTQICGQRKCSRGKNLSWSNFEIYRKFEGSSLKVERHTVHISDDSGRIAMQEIRTFGSASDDNDTDEKLTRYIYSNHLQSASLELDDTGEIISYEEYHPYGTTSYQAMNAAIKATAKRYRYTGKERDEESGLYYHGARYYIPWLCRWTASDPMESKYAGMSPYNYSFNNPVMFNDPSGADPDGDAPSSYRIRPQSSVDNNAVLNNINTNESLLAPTEGGLSLAENAEIINRFDGTETLYTDDTILTAEQLLVSISHYMASLNQKEPETNNAINEAETGILSSDGWSPLYKSDLVKYANSLGNLIPTDNQLGELFERLFDQNLTFMNLAYGVKKNRSLFIDAGDRNTVPDFIGDVVGFELGVGNVKTGRVRGANWIELKAMYGKLYASSNDNQIKGHINNLSARFGVQGVSNKGFKPVFTLFTTADVGFTFSIYTHANSRNVKFEHRWAEYRIVDNNWQFRFTKSAAIKY